MTVLSKNSRQPLLGVCPIGKFLFSHEDAVRQKRAVLERLDALGVRYVTTDEALPDSDGLVRDQAHVEPAVTFLKSRGVDAVFLPHCNFGTEGAAGMIVRRMGLPALVWGPRDDAPQPNGSRLRDSLCGMFASTKVIRKLAGPDSFTYIPNCAPEDPVFAAGLDVFLRAANVVRAARGMKVGLLGSRIDFFWTTIVNESELLERFGFETTPIDIADFIGGALQRADEGRAAYAEELEELARRFLDCTGVDRDELIKGLAARDELLAVCEKNSLSAIATQNFYSIGSAIGSGAAIYNMLAAEKVLIADESDIHGAITSVLVNAAKTTDDVVFFPEFVVRHPDNDNAVCLWHVGAPASLRHPTTPRVGIKPPWILPGEKPTQAQMRLKDGDLTLCRFDGDTGEYRLGVGQARTVEGPYTRDFYAWVEVNDWPAWERRLMEGPYIHHCSAAYGHCADALTEAGKYLRLPVERFDG